MYAPAAGALLVVLVLNALLGPARGAGGVLLGDVALLGVLVGAAAATAWRARIGPERVPWLIATAALLLWAAGEAVYRISEPDPRAQYPRATELLLGAAFALAYVTLVLLARERIRRFDPVLALDGAIAGLTAVAVASMWLLPAEAPDVEGARPGVAPLLAALAALWFVVTVLGLTGWRPGWAWGLITLGIALNVLGDAVLVELIEAGRWQRGAIADPLLVSGAALLGLAALMPLRPARRVLVGPRRLPIPLSGGTVALGVLVIAAAWRDVGLAAVILAAVALIATLARMAVALELLERARSEVATDPLTGLGNRRRLIDELERRVGVRAVTPFALALFDLDGFKAYNDRFGHLGGDALLQRLAGRLADAVGPAGAFRMGGDEFCAVVEGGPDRTGTVLAQARAALAEHGRGFVITASCGIVRVPAEARTAVEALRLADARMYVDKASAARPPEPLALDAAVRRGAPEDPLHDIGSLGAEVARRLGISERRAERIGRAAELHDIGKIAVPLELLKAPGRLGVEEMRLVRQHAVIGERILRVAPELSDLAPLVRASHERFDGRGYPDGIVGEQIPLGGRIVAACDAYDAMVHRAAHRTARSPAEALDELRGGAGTQFDPRIVAAFEAVLGERMAAAAAEQAG